MYIERSCGFGNGVTVCWRRCIKRRREVRRRFNGGVREYESG